MIKCEAIKDFTLGKFNEIKNLVRFNPNFNEKGRLYLKDKFECDEDLVRYLTGENDKKIIVARVIEIIHDEVKEEIKIEEKIEEIRNIEIPIDKKETKKIEKIKKQVELKPKKKSSKK